MNTRQELLLPPYTELEHDPATSTLLIVPGYCHFAAGAKDYTDPRNWYLNKYQQLNPVAEVSYILNMLRLSLHELRANPHLYVAYSGGYTSKEAGAWSSEAGSYLRVAELMITHPAEQLGDVSTKRIIPDTSSYNSNHNIWCSLSHFYQQFGVFPARVKFYAYSLKVDRLKMVASALGLNEDRFSCEIVQGPVFTAEDQSRERAIVEDMRDDILLLDHTSRHAQLTHERNWSNKPTLLVDPEIIRDYYAGLAVEDGFAILNLPVRERRHIQHAAD